MNLESLIEKLEKATERSRELDFEIARAVEIIPPQAAFADVQYDRDYGWCWGGPADYIEIPAYTTSLDAALTLVPGSVVWKVGDTASKWAAVGKGNYSSMPRYFNAATVALALCAAALFARTEDWELG